MKKIMTLALFACSALPSSFLAGQDAKVSVSAGESRDSIKVSSAAPTSKALTDAALIDVNFPNDEIRNIIRSVAELNDLNVVIPETLVGKVSIKLNQVTWRQVFDVVLEPIGYTYIEEGNIIKIRSIKDLMTEPMQTQVFLVNYAKASELCPAIVPLVDAVTGGRALVDARTNSLVVTERSSRLKRIEEIVKRLDRPTDQVMIESKFIEVTDTQLNDLGIDWSSLKGLTGTAKLGQTVTSTYDNNISDAKPALGTDYVRVNSAVLSMNSFSMVLNALKSDDKVQMMSNPTIVTMNNVPAAIHIGEEYPIPNYQYNEEKGTYEISGFEYKPIGISMDVTPQVNNNGLINLKIKPEISSKNGTVTFGGASGASIPIITQRTTSSTVTIKSGYTLAIGGLMQSTTSGTESKVPLLGRIPGLGRLFTNNSDSKDKRNLVIFITAKILDPEGSTYKDVVSKESMLELGIGDVDVPGHQMSGEEAALYEKLQAARNERQNAEKEARMRIELKKLDKSK
jgi:type IV pilus assembly protein PilQ